MTTIQVRIAVVVDADGKWCAAGESGGTDESSASTADELLTYNHYGADLRRTSFVTATVPVPEMPPEPTVVEGDVQVRDTRTV